MTAMREDPQSTLRNLSEIEFSNTFRFLKNFDQVMLMTFYFFMTVIGAYQTQAYRHTIFSENPPLCNNLTCTGGVQHTACGMFEPHSRCSGFELLDMTGSIVHTMVMGQNGIRHKIAGDWNIGNMNILHWSRELERLSQYFLMYCLAEKDVCDFLVTKDVKIGHNYYYSSVPPSARWAGRAVRGWYSQLGFNIKTWDEYVRARNKGLPLDSFTQMIWPETEFVGCAAARMFDGYLATCYYHPPLEKGWDAFRKGKGCSQCPDERPVCSRFFARLCGLDISYGCAEHLTLLRRTFGICVTFQLLIIIYFNAVILI